MKDKIKSKLEKIKPITKGHKFKLLANFVTFIILLLTIMFIVNIYF